MTIAEEHIRSARSNMILLPRGNPVKENVDPGKVNLLEALRKLRAGSFTGYLRFDHDEGTGILIYQGGNLSSALFAVDGARLVACDAIAKIFTCCLAGGTRLGIYRLSPGLATSIHALLHGELLYKGQELKLIDIRALLGKLKEERINGCLRIYTGERIALIFYRNGTPLGFFHDGSTDIETTADTSMSVARLPGAKVDVLRARQPEEDAPIDLAASADLAALWERAQQQIVRRRTLHEEEARRAREELEKERRRKARALLRRVAEADLGRIGASLVDKEFEKIHVHGPLTETDMKGFYDRLSRSGRLVAGVTAIQAMIEEMKRQLKDLVKAG
jgi:hypothetical protein